MPHRKHPCWARWHSRAWLAALCLAVAPLASANIDVDIHGVDDPLRTNVLAYLSFERYKKRTDLSADIIERLHNRVQREEESALKPFGYFVSLVVFVVLVLVFGVWRFCFVFFLGL